MQHAERSIHTRTGQNVYVQEWRAEQPKGNILLVHGLGEHSGRYSHVAARLTQAGYNLIAFDLPGHGKSAGTRGHIASYQEVNDLITQMLSEIRQRTPGLPVFLYGHSLGGILTLYYALTCRPDLNGMIVTSPGLGTAQPVPAWKLMIGKILYNLVPAFSLSNGLDLNGLSHDPAVVHNYQTDPLVHPKVSARLGLDLLSNGTWIADHPEQFPDLPLLLMQGDADIIASPEKTRRFAQALSGNVTFKMWTGLYHELHNEPNCPEVMDMMVNWLDQQLSTGA